jgi:O-antigen ligase
VAAFASVVLDVLQIIGGDDSPLRFYESATRGGRAVGLFANADHSAALLYSTIPFIAAWAIGLVLDHRPNRGIGLAVLAFLILFIVIGVAATQSRAGMALLFVASLSGILLAWRHDRDQLVRRLLVFAIGANVVALILAFQFGFVSQMRRAEERGLEDIRWPVARMTSQIAIANMPLGSGLGTFVPMYERFEPRTSLQNFYINHAHNDWLELWLTGGVPAILLLFGFLAWFAARTFRLWRSGQSERRILDPALARAAPIVVILLLLHSVVDYPLRIPTLSVLFAIACAYLVPLRRIEHERFAPENTFSPHSR